MRRPGEVPMGVVLEGMPEGHVAEAGAGSAEIGQRRGLVIGAAHTGSDERRQTPPGAEIEIDVGEEHRRLMIAVIGIEASAARAEFGVAAEGLELRAGAIFASDIEAQPVVPLIADAEADEERYP